MDRFTEIFFFFWTVRSPQVSTDVTVQFMRDEITSQSFVFMHRPVVQHDDNENRSCCQKPIIISDDSACVVRTNHFQHNLAWSFREKEEFNFVLGVDPSRQNSRKARSLWLMNALLGRYYSGTLMTSMALLGHAYMVLPSANMWCGFSHCSLLWVTYVGVGLRHHVHACGVSLPGRPLLPTSLSMALEQIGFSAHACTPLASMPSSSPPWRSPHVISSSCFISCLSGHLVPGCFLTLMPALHNHNNPQYTRRQVLLSHDFSMC